MKAYLDLLQRILDRGVRRKNRTGVDTIGVFAEQLRVDLRAGFPLLTTKKVPSRWVLEELLWFLSGSTDERELRARGVDIWKEWATPEQCARFGREEGDLGPVYGWQWRSFGRRYPASKVGEFSVVDPFGADKGFDQIAWVEQEIRRNPESRRLVVSAWHPADAQRVALPPCHTLFQFYVAEPGPFASAGAKASLSLHLYARSIDAFLGLPFNVASYALLTHAFAACSGLGVGDLVISFGDLHLYENHLEQAREQLSREPRALPTLRVQPRDSVLNLRAEDFSLHGYDPHPAIRAEVAV